VAKIEALTASSQPLGPYVSLVPADDCRHVLEAIWNDSAPAPLEDAARLARRLVESYPARAVADGKTYATVMAACFAEFPVSMGKRVVHPVYGLPGRLKFLPTVAEVVEALKAEQKRRDTIAATAGWMIKERKRREQEAADEARMPSPERRKELAERARAIMAQCGGEA
jgi:hypothetical protein